MEADEVDIDTKYVGRILKLNVVPATEGDAMLFGKPVDTSDLTARLWVGYMAQSFSLYSELTVRQNLDLDAHLFHTPQHVARQRIAALIERFGQSSVGAPAFPLCGRNLSSSR